MPGGSSQGIGKGKIQPSIGAVSSHIFKIIMGIVMRALAGNAAGLRFPVRFGEYLRDYVTVNKNASTRWRYKLSAR
jgi:hypothetical protein